MPNVRNLLLGLGAAVLGAAPNISASADAPAVVVSISPVHSLVEGIMQGVGRPALLVPGGASPHSWSMRPSEARMLESADVVVWMGEGLESFLGQPLEALAADAYVLELSRAEGVTLLRHRKGGAWEEHDDHHGEEEHHDDEHREGGRDEEKHDDHEHAEDKHDDHGHAEGKHDEDEHDGHRAEAHGKEDEDRHVHREDGHEHHAGEYDMHLWLDPANAAVMAGAVADALARLDPEHESVYRENAAALEARLHALDEELAEAFAPVKDRGFIVFHDAWQYLDTRYGLRAVGSVTVDPDHAPGAARLAELQEKIAEAKVDCVFAEPQFEPRLIRTLVDGTEVATGVLDPLGIGIEAGPDLYFDLMRANARAFRACFGH